MKLKPKIKTTETYKYQTYFDEGGTAIFIADAKKGLIVDCNKAACDLLKRPKSDLIGSHQSSLHPKDQAKKYEAKFKEHVKSGEKIDFEAEVVDATGKRLPVVISAKLLELDGHVLIEGSFIDISPLKVAEWNLYKQEVKYRKIFENAGELIVYLDPEGKVVEISPRCLQMLGYKPKELVGRHFLKTGLYHGPLKTGEVVRLFKELLSKDGSVGTLEIELESKKGKIFPVEVTTSLVKKEGKIVGILALVKDICERKKAEEAERESQKKYKAIFDNIDDQIVYLDRFGKILEINKKVKDIFGRKQKDVIGKNFMQLGLFKLSDLPRVISLYEQVVQEGKTVGPFEMEMKDVKGKLFPAEVILSPYKENHHIGGFLCVVRDLRKIKRAEAELKEMEVKYRELIDFSPDAVIVLNDKGVVVEVNRAALKMVGLKRSEYLGKHFTKLGIFDKKDLPGYIKIFNQALKGEVEKKVVFRYLDRKGRKREAEGRIVLIKRKGKVIGGQVVLCPDR